MTQLYASITAGTAATMMAITLVMLRINFQGRRPVVALMRRWIATGTPTSGLVLTLICAIAVYSFARIPAHQLSEPASVPSTPASANDADASSTADQSPFEALRAYADNIGADNQPTAATPQESASLPDVNTMIEKLVARLEKQPGDVKGWKTLGWSYLNTERPEEAEKAYTTALKIDPADIEIKKGLEAAKAAQTAPIGILPPDPATSAVDNTKAADGLSDSQRDGMIRGMVDRLADRLETAPNDEDGWLRLIHSRVTLGETDAAKTALAKALQAFSSDVAVKARLTSAARELGVESN